jgi:hypothetical protein
MFPNELLTKAGRHSIAVTDRLRKSNAIEFVVRPAGGGDLEPEARGGDAAVINVETPEPASSAAGRVGEAARQLQSLVGNVKAWGAKGNGFESLGVKRALADGLFPAGMLRPDGVPANPWGGPVDVGPAPPAMGDTFLVVFSGVPDEECVRLSLTPSASYKVYAGTFLDTSSPADAEAAKSLCATGNMWFVAK